jgi:hypothetical protein
MSVRTRWLQTILIVTVGVSVKNNFSVVSYRIYYQGFFKSAHIILHLFSVMKVMTEFWLQEAVPQPIIFLREADRKCKAFLFAFSNESLYVVLPIWIKIWNTLFTCSHLIIVIEYKGNRPHFFLYSIVDFFTRSNKIYFVRFEVSTAVTMKNAVFWNVTPCRSCVNRRFRNGG